MNEAKQSFHSYSEEEEEEDDSQSQTNIESDFMRPPTEDTLWSRYQAFFDTTSNEALRHKVCAVCALEQPAKAVCNPPP